MWFCMIVKNRGSNIYEENKSKLADLKHLKVVKVLAMEALNF